MIKLVAIDVDGTLLNSQGKILESTKRTIQKAIKRNIKVVLCSGRPLAGVKSFLRELNIVQNNQYVITFNGAVVETVTGTKLKEEGLSAITYRNIAQFADDHHVSYNFVDANSEIITSNLDVSRITVIQAWENNAGILIRKPQELSENTNIIKAVFADEKKQLDNIEIGVKQHFGQSNYVVRAADNFLEVMHKNVNKGIALQFLAQKLGISSDEIMAIGDEKNDIPMLKCASISVVMGNGSVEAQKYANFKTLSNNKDGIELAFKQFVFK